MGRSPRCYIPSFEVIGLLVLEIFEGFLSGNTEMLNEVDFPKSTLNSEINLLIYFISPDNVFSVTNYHKEQHFKP